MRMYDLILKKRHNEELSSAELQYIVNGYVQGTILDYQMSAFLMAVMFTGMTKGELGAFTMAMAQSGDMVDLSSIDGVKVDKHSTGGVGDKTTLIIAALVAACGGKMAKMSGRGLGHTGGTIDKMESIPGLTTILSESEFIHQVNTIGVAVMGQSENIAPADKKIYALRDVTATVDSIPLIASSIMSKKLASGADAILLDVKMGSGAFMKTLDDARELARTMVDIGRENGRTMRAIITDMDVPLGQSIGNALEIREVIRTLHNEGPQDLTHECLVMAGHLLVMSGLGSYEDCFAMAEDALHSGKACESLRAMIIAQGGDGAVVDDTSLLGSAKYSYDVVATESGYIQHMNTEQCGIASVMLGAGRTVKDGPIDMTAGIVMHKKTGDAVSVGTVLATLYANDESLFANAARTYSAALQIGEEQPVVGDTIIEVVGDSVNLSVDTIRLLVEAATEGRSYSYSPYSNFAVGAAVLCSDGTIYTGCNVENASFGMTNCAERTAIFKAVSDGHQTFQAIAIVADTNGPCAPCGACRQVISEFDIPSIIMGNLSGCHEVLSLEELLPRRFGKHEL